MNIGNITSNNFNLDGNGKDMQIEVYEQLIEQLQQENQKLKKQLEDTNEELELVRCDLHNRTSERDGYYRNIDMLENQQKEFISYLESEIYSIEPKGTGINYNCEYDSEEDYINAMEEQSKLNTFKEILSKYKEIIGGKE